LKRTYKRNKEYRYKRYLLEFPIQLNEKIEPHLTKNFDAVDITAIDTPKQEFVNISLVRNKTPEEPDKQKSP